MNKTYKHIEGLLYNYKTIKAAINHNRIKLENLEIEDGLNSIDFEIEKSNTNKIGRIAENAAIKNIEEKEKLKKQIELDINKIRLIDNALENLQDIEKEIITLFYIEDWPWWKVAHNVSYSEGWCKAKRNQIIKKIASYW